RTLELAHPPAVVWAALTTAEGLGTWFGNKADIDLRPGGTATLEFDSGDVARLRIEHVDEPNRFAYTWHLYGAADDDPRRTDVEVTLRPNADGTTLTLVESGFAQVTDEEHKRTFGGNSEGWTHELGELVAYLDARA